MAYLGFERALRGCLPALLAAAIIVPTMAAAQQAETALWTKTCTPNPNNAKEQRCNTGQEVWLNQDGSARASLGIEVKPDKKIGVAGFVPLGFMIPTGVILAIDGEKKGIAQFMQCTPPLQDIPPGCFIAAEVTEDFIAGLRKGNKLALVLTNGANQQLPIELSLVGFAKAYDGEGLDPVAARAQQVEKSKQFQEAAKAAAQRMIDKQRQETGQPAPAPAQ
jgi:invasion protein IalB